jgi:streptogramin lyase
MKLRYFERSRSTHSASSAAIDNNRSMVAPKENIFRFTSSWFGHLALIAWFLMFGLIMTEKAAAMGRAEAPLWITTGPDGNLWIADYANNQIGRVTTNGVVTFFPTPTASARPAKIVAGPDGALWFTEFAAGKIGRITTAGVITEFVVPSGETALPSVITPGPDGALWFTEFGSNKIGRITTGGVVTEFPIPTTGSRPVGITAGPDGALWFAMYGANRIGRVTTAGSFAEFKIPGASWLPFEIRSFGSPPPGSSPHFQFHQRTPWPRRLPSARMATSGSLKRLVIESRR